MVQLDPFFGNLIFWAFMFLVSIMLMNVLMAIVIDKYMAVKADAEHCPHFIPDVLNVIARSCRARWRQAFSSEKKKLTSNYSVEVDLSTPRDADLPSNTSSS